MTLQERLRAGALPKGIMGHWGDLQCEAADRIDELEKESNLLNVAWLQGEFSELQAKVEILLNEHAERGVRIEELESVSDVDEMALRDCLIKAEREIEMLWRELEAKQARIDKLEGAIERMRVAGGSVEFQGAFELAKDLLCRNASS